MIADVIRAARERLPSPTTRSDLAVSAYCHAFGTDPPVVADGGTSDDER